MRGPSGSQTNPSQRPAGIPAGVISILLAAALLAAGAHHGASPAHARGSDLSDVAEEAVQSVVNISSTKARRFSPQDVPFHGQDFLRRFFGPGFPDIPRERRERSLGSGVVVSGDGIVITNNHVVKGAEEITVRMNDGRELDAEIVGTDPQSDVAVIRIQGKEKGFRALPWGDSDDLRLAQTVLAIGNPFGIGQTLTKGIVSARGRADVGIVDYEDFIQTDAAINPGNSGGALINTQGELVGINTAIVSRSGGNQGIGFAIPSNMVRRIMDSLLEHGRVTRGWLGISIQNIDQDLAEALDLDASSGVLIAGVTEDSPAEKAGLETGDVITQVNGNDVTTTGEIRNAVAASGAGARVTIRAIRDGRTKTFKVTLGELPAELDKSSDATRGRGSGTGGMVTETLTDRLRERFDIDEDVEEGVVVTRVAPDSQAAENGIRPGDVVLEVNREQVTSRDELRREFDRADDRVLLLIHRNGGTRFVVLKKKDR